MAVIDLKKVHKELYGPKMREAHEVKAPAFKCLMVDGQGDPQSVPAFQEAVEILFGLSYTLKFHLKKKGLNFTVMPLEGLFWADDPSAFREERRNEWRWTMLIVQPREITAKDLAAAEAELAEKRRLAMPLPVRLEALSEGLCVQILHKGPYNEEGPTIAALHGFMESQGYAFNGKHHEVYLSDPKRVKPEAIRTIIRQPVMKS